ncbi:MAG: glycine oxidase ThiO [Candidatus Omnitrophica bacterium]|nr:glycine oxidase ThiO [Candidatus Omnitrophota bacterium]
MKNFDALVVGGGIIGCTLACELRKAGLRVAVVERSEPGTEASIAAAGMLAPHAGPQKRTPFFAVLRRALALYPDFIAEVEEAAGIPTEFKKNGLFYLAFSPEDEAVLAEKLELQLASGIRAEWVLGEEIRRRDPAIGPELRKGIYFPEDCQVDNILLMKAVIQWSRRLGVEWITAAPATEIWLEGERVRGLVSGRERWESPVVINAAGSWANFDRSLPFEIPVKPSRGQILVLQSSDRVPVFKHMLYTRKIYTVSRDDGRLIVGSTVESVGFNKEVTVKGLHKFLRGLLEINPEFLSLPFRECWAGLRPRSKDGLPILGKSPVEGLYLAAGHFRNGILLAPLTARVLTALILNRPPEVDLSPFAWGRFQTREKKISQ